VITPTTAASPQRLQHENQRSDSIGAKKFRYVGQTDAAPFWSRGSAPPHFDSAPSLPTSGD
jgi:hypothetical protein